MELGTIDFRRMASSSKKVVTTRSMRPRKQRNIDSRVPEPEKRGVNTSGLAVLPDELLLEILSYLPSLPALSESHFPNDATAYVQQRDFFLALSTSCQHLRRFFRPYVWRRLEVTSGMCIGETVLRPRGGKKGEVAYATELIRLLEIVTIRDPSLAEFVQIVNFEITDFSINSVLVELGRCFSLFPNLHTVKLDMHNSFRRWDMVMFNGFAKHSYPSIRHVILAPRAYPLLPSCPNLKSVQCIPAIDVTELLKYLRKTPSIGSVGYSFRLTELEDAVKALPNVRQLSIRHNYYWFVSDLHIEAILDNLVLLQQLQEVILELSCYTATQEIIIRKVIQQLQSLHERDGGKKQIRVLNASYTPQIITIPPKRTPAL